MTFAENEICRITESIWHSILGLDVRRTVHIRLHDGTQRFLTGCVQITGAWQGAVTVDCSTRLARRIAALMFGIDPDAAKTEEIRDALGELTNMTGGNIKSLLPSPCALSLPTVAEGLDYTISFPGGRLLSQVAFDCQGEPLLITLMEKDEELAAVQETGRSTTAMGSRR